MVKLVGILNVTPDSFSDGGNYLDVQKAVEHARSMFCEGASFVDIGAESTRPNAEVLTADDEWQRLEPVVKILLQEFPGKLSLDTYHAETVRRALAMGPMIINDVTGFQDPEMQKAVLEFLPPKIIISHLPAETVSGAHSGVLVSDLQQIKDELILQASQLEKLGFPKSGIVLDPGIGFGKTPELNQQLLQFADSVVGYEVMIGYSKKRFLGEDRMEIAPNIEAGKVAVQHGATYLRVHDVLAHVTLL